MILRASKWEGLLQAQTNGVLSNLGPSLSFKESPFEVFLALLSGEDCLSTPAVVEKP